MKWVFVALVAALAVTAGCAHYGYADEVSLAGHNEADAAVSVWTVATPADEGMNSARLTRALVGALEQRGLAARWTSDSRSTALRCSITETNVDGFQQALLARAEARCYLGPGEPDGRVLSATGRHTASSDAGRGALASDHSDLQEAAALDALDALADEFVRRRLDDQ